MSCLVYLPRDRYNTHVRERISAILKRELGGDTIEYTAKVSESMLARLHFVVRPPKGETMTDEVQVAEVERKLAERRKDGKVEPLVEQQFSAGRLYAVIASRPGQSGRADGYILEGSELEFYIRRLRSAKSKHA